MLSLVPSVAAALCTLVPTSGATAQQAKQKRRCDLDLTTIVADGATVATLTVQGPPLQPVTVYMEVAGTSTPIFAPGFGYIAVNFATALTLPMPATNAAGLSSWSTVVPSSVAGIGLIFQGYTPDLASGSGAAVSDAEVRFVHASAPLNPVWFPAVPPTVMPPLNPPPINGFGGASALAVADWDGDGNDDVFVGSLGSDDFFYSPTAGAFIPGQHWTIDVFGALAVPPQEITTDAIFADVDNDNDMDLIVCHTPPFPNSLPTPSTGVNRLYENIGGTFVEVLGAFGVIAEYTAAVDVADIDLDGDLDVMFANNGAFSPGAGLQVDRVYLNNLIGTGVATSFTDVTAAAVPGLTVAPADSTDLDFADLDLDGDEDIVITTITLAGGPPANLFLLNVGGGVFAGPFPLPGTVFDSTCVEIADLDGDPAGMPEIVIGNYRNLGGPQPNTLLMNTSPVGAFPVYANLSVPNLPDGTVGTPAQPTNDLALVDFDEDGDLDLWFANGEFLPPYSLLPFHNLFLNNGAGVFTDSSASIVQPTNTFMGSTVPLNSWAVEPIAWPGDATIITGTSPTHVVTTDLGLLSAPPFLTFTGPGLGLVPYMR
ncbi:MAG: VCBS repeat-containing protein [bacterium]|nr:VCBS repeat-containing protein [bacterium]